MILEIADVRVDPGRGADFEAAVKLGVDTVIAYSKGFSGYKLNRSVETPGRYVLMIYWQTLEDHTIGFRGGNAFTAWRAIVGPFFVSPPVVEHFELAGKTA
jgi:heme-degrading monooxygenase HmoA